MPVPRQEETLVFLDTVTSSLKISGDLTNRYQRLLRHSHSAHGSHEGHEDDEEESLHEVNDLGTTLLLDSRRTAGVDPPVLLSSCSALSQAQS